jgi:autotransporter-associated beta strand protein
MNGYSDTINGLTGSGFVDNVTDGGAATSVLTIGANDTTSNTFTGVIQNTTGLVAITKNGTGTLTLTGNNTYAGGTTLNAGTLSANRSESLGAASGNLTFAGNSTLATTANITSSRNYTINSAVSATINTTASTTLTNNGVVSGDGNLIKQGTGILALGGNNTYAGSTTVGNGILIASHANALGAAAGGLSVVDGATLDLSDSITVTKDSTVALVGAGENISGDTVGALRNFGGDNILNGSGNIEIGNATVTTTEINANSGNLTIAGSGVIQGGASANQTLQLHGAGNGTISRGIQNGTSTALSIVKAEAGTWILGNANTYNGSTTISGGTLRASTANALGGTASIAVNGATSTLEITSSDAVNDDAGISLGGGTIVRGETVTETFGALTLTADSFINFGSTGTGTLNFGTYANGSNTYKLAVTNFLAGNVLTFTTDLSSDIETTSLFTFDNGFTYGWDSGSSTFTITAVPEPSTIIAAILFLGLVCYRERRRIKALFS